jgi:hypothetical protein
MISLLNDIYEFLTHIPQYILLAVEELINTFFAGIQVLLELTVAVLPELPETISPPEYVEAINWFFPIGAVLAIVAPMIAAYVIWLSVKWIFNKLGEL